MSGEAMDLGPHPNPPSHAIQHGIREDCDLVAIPLVILLRGRRSGKDQRRLWPSTFAWAKWGAWGKGVHLPARNLCPKCGCVARTCPPKTP